MRAWLRSNGWVGLFLPVVLFGSLALALANGFDWLELELAATQDAADAIVDRWEGSTARLAMSLGADSLFALSYGVALAVAVAWSTGWTLRSTIFGVPAFFGALAAAAFDLVENVLLFLVLGGADHDWITGLATVAALAKFALATLAVLFVVIVGFWQGIRRSDRYPAVAVAAIGLVLAMFVLGELDGVLQGMHTDAAPATSIGQLAGEFPWDRDHPAKTHAVDVWHDWEQATTPTKGEERAFATPESVVRWYVGVDTLLFLPAYAVVLAFLLDVLRRRFDARSLDQASPWRTTRRALVGLLVVGAVADLVENAAMWVVFKHDSQGGGTAWVAFTWVLFLARWAKLAALGLLLAGIVVVGARAGWSNAGTRIASIVRGAAALRVPIVLLLLLAVAYFGIIPGDFIDQLTDVIRAWNGRTASAALYFTAGLALTIWLTSWATRQRVLRARGSGEQRPVAVDHTARDIAAWTMIAVGLGAIAANVVPLPFKLGLGLVVPGVLIAGLWVLGLPLPALPDRSKWRRAHHQERMQRLPEGDRVDYRIIHPAVPRLLAAAAVVVMGVAIVRTAVPQLAHADVDFDLGWPLLWVLVVWSLVPVLRRFLGGVAVGVSDSSIAAVALAVIVVPPAVIFLGRGRADPTSLSAETLLELGIYACLAAFFVYYFLDEDFNVFATGDGTTLHTLTGFFSQGWKRWLVLGIAGTAWFLLGLWLAVAPLTAAPELGTTAVMLLWVISFAILAHFMSRFAEKTAPAKAVYWLGLERTPMFLGLVVWLVVVGAIGALRVDSYHDVRIVKDADDLGVAAELTYCADWHADHPSEVDTGRRREITVQQAFERWRCINGLAPPWSAEPRQDDEEVAAVPMFFVSAWGGGIRAAVWTSYALDCVFEPEPAGDTVRARIGRTNPVCVTPARRDSGVASDRLFAASGISGGALGLFEYAAWATDRESGADAIVGEERRTWVDLRLADDYLAPTMSQALFVDIPLYFAGYLDFADDRAAVLERAWEASWTTEGGDDRLRRGLYDLWFSSARVPLIVANGASFGEDCLLGGSVLDEAVALQVSGEDTVAGDPRLHLGSPDDCISLLGFEDFDEKPSQDEAVAGSLGGMRDLANYLCPEWDVRLSTAALLAARFGYVSPSGRLKRVPCEGDDPDEVPNEEINVIDGGYTEGSGTLTADQLWQAAEPLVAAHNARAGAPCIVPVMIHLENGYAPPQPPRGASEPNEWLVPPAGGGGLVDTARQRAALEFTQPLHAGGLDVMVTSAGAPVENRYAFLTTRAHPGVEAPLGWTLSDEAFTDLAVQLEFNRGELAEIATWLGELRCSFAAPAP